MLQEPFKKKMAKRRMALVKKRKKDWKWDETLDLAVHKFLPLRYIPEIKP